jgi:hypothetical protein
MGSIKENKRRRTDTQKGNEEKFQSIFNDLFDIAHQDALHTMTIGEDKEFWKHNVRKGGEESWRELMRN